MKKGLKRKVILSTKMNYDTLVKFVQQHFTDGLALVIGSGLSAAEGMPGMPELATYLSDHAGVLTGTDSTLWNQIKAVLDADEGLEAALNQQRAGRNEPIVFVLHAAHPRVEYTDRGKSALVIGGAA